MSSRLDSQARENLAREIREALGSHNDPNEPVVTLVRKVSALAEARAAPTGEWVTVPREPTPKMMKALGYKLSTYVDHKPHYIGRYQAMLAVAPPAPAAEPVAYADPQALRNFKDHGHLGGVHAREWMWAKPDAGLVPLYTAPPPVEASQQQADDYLDALDELFKGRGNDDPLYKRFLAFVDRVRPASQQQASGERSHDPR